MKCRLDLTHRVRGELAKWAADEGQFFSLQNHFDVHIERLPEKDETMAFSFFFDNETNGPLSRLLDGRVAVMDCLYKNDGFLAINFRVKGRREPVRTNRRHSARLSFMIGGHVPMPLPLYNSLRRLPVAKERSEYVEKRIASWEGYLRIEEKNADVEDIHAKFSHGVINENFTRLSLVCSGLNGKQLAAVTGFSAKLKGQKEDLGTVVDVDRSRMAVKIELSRKNQGLARKGTLLPEHAGEVVFSNFAQLSQVRRLRKGFKDLQYGMAANPNLEKILFEERPVVQVTNERLELDFHHNLNEFQREAVTGAMSSKDLYVIQGPPGTGKTTVISELCHQLVKAGMRTLVASQSNLAVDNALGRLLSDPGIRILRYGRTESIEEEGKRFIEENVALHWKEETLAMLKEQDGQQSALESKLVAELDRIEKEKKALQLELPALEEKIELKKTAEAEVKERSEKLKELRSVDNEKAELMEEAEKELATAKEEAFRAATDMEALTALLEREAITQSVEEEMQLLSERVAACRKTLLYFQAKDAVEAADGIYARLAREAEDLRKTTGAHLGFLEEMKGVRKLEAFQQLLDSLGVKPSLQVGLEINALRRRISDIQTEIYSQEYLDWEGIDTRLTKATEMLKKLLGSCGYPVDTIQLRRDSRYPTPEEMTNMIDKIGRFIVSPGTKSVLALPDRDERKTKLLSRIAENVAFLLGKKEEVGQRLESIKVSSRRQAAEKFSLIKANTAKEVADKLPGFAEEEKRLREEMAESRGQLDQLKAELASLAETADVRADRDAIDQEIADGERMLSLFERRKVVVAESETALSERKLLAEKAEERITRWQAVLEKERAERETCKKGIEDHEARIAMLSSLLEEKPEFVYKEKLTTIAHLAEKAKSVKKEQARIPVIKSLQNQWLGLLEEASEYDLDEIRKLYVKYANVIGTTCVASARREFMEDYPVFDVVIIDEVSKATPPELLLPMLKGKKIILVGDHHQLPPLVGRETMEEFVEEIEDEHEKNELRKLLKESLFERLFRTLPKGNKTMLGIQYRMHEEIMETIAPFYEEGDYSLKCGLENSDDIRDHKLETRFFDRKDHIVWLDVPNKPPFFEAKVKGGTSLYNEAELGGIEELLAALDKSVEEAKNEGEIGLEEKKSVGIISFYGEQVKRIDRLIEQNVKPRHLHCRTGSVDKFQGMEMDVIVLSFVRNHDQPSGTIGFAEDYRRLNVALSRARELLVIIGSSDMFTKRPKNPAAKTMYTRLYQHVKNKQAIKNLSTVAATH